MRLQRRYEYRRNLPHIQKDGHPLFITFHTIENRILPFKSRDVVMRHILTEHGKRCDLHAAVVMPEHVHLILTPLRDISTQAYTLAEILHSIKSVSAHSINRLLARKGHLWRDESFDHVLRTHEKLQDRVNYVRMNPVRRHLVSRPEDYKWLWISENTAEAAVPHRFGPGGWNAGT